MNELIDPLLGWGLSKAGDLAISSWGAYRMLFAPAFGGATRDWLSRTRASAAFYNARRTVPAYRDFLRERNETWREDATNRDLTIPRNLVRHEVMPRLRAIR